MIQILHQSETTQRKIFSPEQAVERKRPTIAWKLPMFNDAGYYNRVITDEQKKIKSIFKSQLSIREQHELAKEKINNDLAMAIAGWNGWFYELPACR